MKSKLSEVSKYKWKAIFYPDLAQSVERMAEDHLDADRNRESGLSQWDIAISREKRFFIKRWDNSQSQWAPDIRNQEVRTKAKTWNGERIVPRVRGLKSRKLSDEAYAMRKVWMRRYEVEGSHEPEISLKPKILWSTTGICIMVVQGFYTPLAEVRFLHSRLMLFIYNIWKAARFPSSIRNRPLIL